MRSRATWMLILVTVFWGLSFPLMKSWTVAGASCPGKYGPAIAMLTFVGIRYGVALAVFGLLWRQPACTWAQKRAGILLGIVYFLGATLQLLGLLWATPALSAFITSMGGAWVAPLAYLRYRTPVPRLTFAGLAVSVAGAFVLAQTGGEYGWDFGKGELLTLAASVLFAVQILILDRIGRVVPSTFLTFSLIGTTFVPSLAIAAIWASFDGGSEAWLAWTAASLSDPNVLIVLAVLVVFSTILAFHWMNVYQPQVPAHRAGLIYFLEPVFGGLFSLLWGYDKPSVPLFLGGALIIAGNLLAEPALWRRRKMTGAAEK